MIQCRSFCVGRRASALDEGTTLAALNEYQNQLRERYERYGSEGLQGNCGSHGGVGEGWHIQGPEEHYAELQVPRDRRCVQRALIAFSQGEIADPATRPF